MIIATVLILFIFWIPSFFRLLKKEKGLKIFAINVISYLVGFAVISYYYSTQNAGDYGGISLGIEYLFSIGLLSIFWSLFLFIYASSLLEANNFPPSNN